VGSLLSWDQETYMPPGAGAHRADQMALIAEIQHKRKTDPRIGELIAKCESDRSLTGDDSAAANVKEMRRDYDLATSPNWPASAARPSRCGRKRAPGVTSPCSPPGSRR
jgi:Zn-dependent M32 family carboxypeptidase